VTDIPTVSLPINFTVLKHPGEKMGKSSIIASKILSPENVVIHNQLEAPDFDYESTILLFPKDDAIPITNFDKEQLSKIKNVVLIDSTWLQVTKFLNNEKVAKLKPVVINTEKTIFWRYQKGKTNSNLSTIEAMYFFMRDYDKVMSESDYDGKYDNLLYFYAYNYALIQNEYTKGIKKDLNFKTIEGYIKDEDKPEPQKTD
jgi:DTW domain-containing protein YfiP